MDNVTGPTLSVEELGVSPKNCVAQDEHVSCENFVMDQLFRIAQAKDTALQAATKEKNYLASMVKELQIRTESLEQELNFYKSSAESAAKETRANEAKLKEALKKSKSSVPKLETEIEALKNENKKLRQRNAKLQQGHQKQKQDAELQHLQEQYINHKAIHRFAQ